MGKTYEYRTTVTIGDTNLLQHMYFVHFFALQGITRDLWVKEVVPGGLESIKNGLVLITRSAHCEYKRDFYLYDKVLVRMQIRNLRNASGELVFKFYNEATMELHARRNPRDRDRKKSWDMQNPREFQKRGNGIFHR